MHPHKYNDQIASKAPQTNSGIWEIKKEKIVESKKN